MNTIVYRMTGTHVHYGVQNDRYACPPYCTYVAAASREPLAASSSATTIVYKHNMVAHEYPTVSC